VRMEVDGTGSGSCPVAGFGISAVQHSDSATAVLVCLKEEEEGSFVPCNNRLVRN